MKKWMIMLIILFSLMFTTSCIQDSEPTVDLIAQFDEYQREDIENLETFNDFINHVSNDIVKGLILVKMTVRDHTHQVVRTKISTGFIYNAYLNKRIIVTALDAITLSDRETATYEVINSAETSYYATVIDRPSEYRMAKLSIDISSGDSDRFSTLTLSKYAPRSKEPILMLSNYNEVKNAMHMGFFESKTSLFYTTTLKIDEHSLGAVIINMRKEVIGIVISVDDMAVTIMGVEALNNYLLQE